MKTKKFNLTDTVVDENGQKHIITIVGILTESKESDLNMEYAHFNVKGCSPDAFFLYKKNNKFKLLQYAFSICHPDDEFNERIGIELAEKRINKRPFGSLKTYQLGTLSDEQVEFILLGELLYIKKNINKYIKK